MSVQLCAASYSLLLYVSLLMAHSPLSHARSTRHIFLLAAGSFVGDLFAAIGPWLGFGHSDYSLIATQGLVADVLVFGTAGTLSTGPRFFRERGRLYNKAVADKLKEVHEPVEPNVIHSSESIIGRFLSISMLGLMRRVSEVDQIDLHELPVLPASMQSEPITIALDPSFRHERAHNGPIMSLILEVVRPNRVLYCKRKFPSPVSPHEAERTADFCCVVIELSLAYVPHFCLQQILAILDEGGSRKVAAVYSALWILAWGAETVARLTRNYDL